LSVHEVFEYNKLVLYYYVHNLRYRRIV